MFAMRYTPCYCALLATLLTAPVFAEDALWSGAAPNGESFTGHSENDAAAGAGSSPSHSDAEAASDDDAVRARAAHVAPVVVRNAGVEQYEEKTDSTSAAPAQAHTSGVPAETAENRLSGAWVLIAIVSIVAALASLSAYAMGCFPRFGDKQAPKKSKKRAVILDVGEQLHDEGNHVAGHAEGLLVRADAPYVVNTVAAPLPAYQFTTLPTTGMSEPVPMYVAGAMSVPAYTAAPAPAYSTPPVPAYATQPAPAYSTPPAPVYAAAPAPVYAAAPAPVYAAAPAPAYYATAAPAPAYYATAAPAPVAMSQPLAMPAGPSAAVPREPMPSEPLPFEPLPAAYLAA